jgi:hypothetical protein
MARQVRQTLPDPPPEYDQQYVASLARSVNNYMGQATALAELIAARFIMTDPVKIPGDLPDTSSLPVGTVYLKKLPALATGHVVAANPAATSSTSFVMMGLGMRFQTLTATNGMLTMNGNVGNTGNGTTTVQLVYGTGTSPANGAPFTGTLIGQPVSYKGPSAGAFVPFAQTVMITTLVPGVSYWIDTAVKVDSGSSILNNVEITGQALRTTDEYFLSVVTQQDL